MSNYKCYNKSMNKIIIAVDGFSSCGKSTMAKDLAKQVGYIYIDSGAMYRTVTLYSMQQGLVDAEGKLDEAKLKADIDKIKIEFRLNSDTGLAETYMNGVNVEYEIRGMEVSNNVSMVSAVPFVRQYTDAILHQMSEAKGVVMDGRDIGTAVFPNAELKIFVTADPKIRAQRRLDELRRKGDNDTSFEDVLENIKQRDFSDQNRKESPLRKAEDAIELDNSHMTIKEQMQWLLVRFNETINKYE